MAADQIIAIIYLLLKALQQKHNRETDSTT